MSTFAALLTRHLREDPGRPLVTFYDDLSGERVELSVTTYANWVAKTASLLVEEFDVERGDAVVLDLPTHWLGPVLLGACWSVGAEVVTPGGVDPVVVVTGPEGLAAHASAGPPVLATALRPLGVRFEVPPPPGVVDFGVEVWSQPDAFVPLDPPGPDDPAAFGLTQGELFADGNPWRLMTSANPVAPDGVGDWAATYAGGGSVVLVRHPDAGLWTERIQAEQITSPSERP